MHLMSIFRFRSSISIRAVDELRQPNGLAQAEQVEKVRLLRTPTHTSLDLIFSSGGRAGSN